MNERLQKNWLNFFSFYDVTGEARGKVRDLFEKKRHTFGLLIKICLAEVRHN